MKDYKLIILF